MSVHIENSCEIQSALPFYVIIVTIIHSCVYSIKDMYVFAMSACISRAIILFNVNVYAHNILEQMCTEYRICSPEM